DRSCCGGPATRWRPRGSATGRARSSACVPGWQTQQRCQARLLRGGGMMGAMSIREQGRVEPIETAPRTIDPGVRIGHVHLRTSDIDRVKAFYCGVLGFDIVAEARGGPAWGTTGDILFVSAGGYHHHLGFNTWKSAGGGPQPDGVA